MSHTSTQKIFIAKIFACTFFLIGGHLFASDWVALTGTNLSDHWVTEGAWILEDDGVIHLPKREYTHWKNYENYLVLKDILVTDFEFKFDWHVNQNSGVYFHIPDLTHLPDRHHKEVQLYENSLWKKPELGDHAAGGIIPGYPPTKNVSNDPNQWNHMHIRCVNNQITVSINDEIVNQADLNKGAAGKRSKHGGFAFQDHGYAVWIKNVQLKNLDSNQ
tara:strand:+ start:112 stop:765 length:654 start_codon:yes stop_codon:yes gene_type:complete